MKIGVIIGSTRQGRTIDTVVAWVKKHLPKDIEIVFLDLKDYPMPFLDTDMSFYDSEIFKKWQQDIISCNGFVVITPEYNHSFPAVLKNALDYLYEEWHGKPITFISYSDGFSGGIRAVEQLRQVVVELRMWPLKQEVTLPYVQDVFDANGEVADERIMKKLEEMWEALREKLVIISSGKA